MISCFQKKCSESFSYIYLLITVIKNSSSFFPNPLVTQNVPGNSDVALDDLELVVLCNELHVERALDVQSLGDLLRDLLDLSQSFLIQVLWRGHESGISYNRFTMKNL